MNHIGESLEPSMAFVKRDDVLKHIKGKFTILTCHPDVRWEIYDATSLGNGVVIIWSGVGGHDKMERLLFISGLKYRASGYQIYIDVYNMKELQKAVRCILEWWDKPKHTDWCYDEETYQKFFKMVEIK